MEPDASPMLGDPLATGLGSGSPNGEHSFVCSEGRAAEKEKNEKNETKH
jgi:hypothetical protein